MTVNRVTNTDTQQIHMLSPAKINLFLHILGQRVDGYHELQTLFQILDYGDDMIFKTQGKDGPCKLTTPIKNVPDADNIIIKAANLLKQHTQCTLGAEISIQKKIPMGAGLGGGSSNAATTLLALNELWKTKLSQQKLLSLGEKLGADVPVFILNHTAFAEGIGEKLTPVKQAASVYLVVTPPVEIASALIFQDKYLTRASEAIQLSAFEMSKTRNDCEERVMQLYPEVSQTLKRLAQFGDARLTGTGSSCFVKITTPQRPKPLH